MNSNPKYLLNLDNKIGDVAFNTVSCTMVLDCFKGPAKRWAYRLESDGKHLASAH